MWFVYMLRCADGSLYIGETNNLLRRRGPLRFRKTRFKASGN